MTKSRECWTGCWPMPFWSGASVTDLMGVLTGWRWVLVGPGGGVGGSTGGRVRDLPGILFGDQEDDQPGVDPGLRECRFLSRQLIEPGQDFQALEGQCELPAEAIKREHVGGREGAGRQGRQQQDVMGGLKTARIGRLAALLGVLDQALFFGLRLLVALAPDDQAQE